MEIDPRIDAFIAGSADFAKPVLTRFRALVHAAEPLAAETIKWGMPHFTLQGKILCGMAAFKAHAAIIVEDAGSRGGEGMGHFGKIRSETEMPDDAVLVELIRQRALAIRSGAKKPAKLRSAKPEIPVPDDFAAALDGAAKAYFNGLASGHRREYLEWIVEAKRPETRAKRIGQAAEWLAEGKKRNWKYENC